MGYSKERAPRPLKLALAAPLVAGALFLRRDAKAQEPFSVPAPIPNHPEAAIPPGFHPEAREDLNAARFSLIPAEVAQRPSGKSAYVSVRAGIKAQTDLSFEDIRSVLSPKNINKETTRIITTKGEILPQEKIVGVSAGLLFGGGKDDRSLAFPDSEKIVPAGFRFIKIAREGIGMNGNVGLSFAYPLDLLVAFSADATISQMSMPDGSMVDVQHSPSLKDKRFPTDTPDSRFANIGDTVIIPQEQIILKVIQFTQSEEKPIREIYTPPPLPPSPIGEDSSGSPEDQSVDSSIPTTATPTQPSRVKLGEVNNNELDIKLANLSNETKTVSIRWVLFGNDGQLYWITPVNSYKSHEFGVDKIGGEYSLDSGETKMIQPGLIDPEDPAADRLYAPLPDVGGKLVPIINNAIYPQAIVNIPATK